ncbi:uracil-DNA glycosylase family protein [Thalassotalea euphylliae]|uniref:Uracil-DNA glycosylase family protein n=1 Tax=Thalassotalea euphylliae TaxID=1655234 RepID=A0A3E0TSM3_9GAMM|nr:uracil-DNA glycosylase family protein [Thalassotalea euphylliae]REL27484.1 uracil-DNA glycosylase family protein [Thalassotalea euphylliae]
MSNELNCDQLLSNIRGCSLCQQQLPLAAKPILQASQYSRILIAGQAPGQVTHDKGRPFDDKSGERLRLWLGVDNQQFYNDALFAIVPMGFCYPGKGKSGDLPPIPLCAKTWRTKLLSEMKGIELTILVGKYALDWHLAKLKPLIGDELSQQLASAKNLTELVKHYDLLLAHHLIALPHPSPRNNIWLKKNPWFEQEVLPKLKQRVQLAIEVSI